MTDQLKRAPETTTPITRAARTYALPRARVFEAWTSAYAVKQWFSPEYFTVPDAQVEPRVGGVFSLCMRGQDGSESWMRGQFLEFVADRRIKFESDVAGPDGVVLFRATTTVDFADLNDGTNVEVEQQYTIFVAVAAQMVRYAAVGWEQTLARLGAMLGRLNTPVSPS